VTCVRLRKLCPDPARAIAAKRHIGRSAMRAVRVNSPREQPTIAKVHQSHPSQILARIDAVIKDLQPLQAAYLRYVEGDGDVSAAGVSARKFVGSCHSPCVVCDRHVEASPDYVARKVAEPVRAALLRGVDRRLCGRRRRGRFWRRRLRRRRLCGRLWLGRLRGRRRCGRFW
jgi:hypothetical protein